MPLKCCVPGCRGNYDDNEKISVFKFPSDAERRRVWSSKIPRENFEPTSRSVVCAKHFSPQFIVTYDSATRPDGSVLTVERSRPKLTDDAYPSIFPNCPTYLSVEPPMKRKKPDQRRAEIEQRDNDVFSQWMQNDKVVDFSSFSENFKAKLDTTSSKSWLYRLHNNSSGQSENTDQQCYWSFYMINDFPATTKPKLASVVRIFSDLRVEVFTETERIGK